MSNINSSNFTSINTSIYDEIHISNGNIQISKYVISLGDLINTVHSILMYSPPLFHSCSVFVSLVFRIDLVVEMLTTKGVQIWFGG